ncbi:tRNA-dependent cyclodipeptide synthase [Spirillospora sp. CA-255316]
MTDPVTPLQTDPAPRFETHFEVEPYTPACRQLLERGEHILIGVSPGNSYFSRERLAALLEWAGRRFAAIDVLYIDLHLDTMYIASGDTPQKARSRATRAIRDTRRRIRGALQTTTHTSSRIRVHALSECVGFPAYQAVRQHIDQEVRSNEQLQKVCDEHVRCIINSRTSHVTPTEEAAMHQAGLAYLYAEMPFLCNTPDILNVPSSLSCYHAFMPVVAAIYDLAGLRHQAQGFVTVRPPTRHP